MIMKRIFIFSSLCALLLPMSSMAQNKVTELLIVPDSEVDECEEPDSRKAILAPDVMPEFPGGLQALMNFIAGEIHYPEQALMNGVQGKVILQFIVTKTGEIGDVEVLRSISPEIDAEAVRVCKLIPRFKPGIVDGQPVNVMYTLPLNFSLSDNMPEVTHNVLDLALDGDMESQYTVGYCYYNGIGVPLDWIVARYYLERAAEQGHEQAAELLGKTRKRLRNELD
jgi:TonB family protein